MIRLLSNIAQIPILNGHIPPKILVQRVKFFYIFYWIELFFKSNSLDESYFYNSFASSMVSGSFFENVSGENTTVMAAIIADTPNNIADIDPSSVSCQRRNQQTNYYRSKWIKIPIS